MCLWLTGLSGAGKSTTARLLTERLGGLRHQVALIDGDELRASVSTDLGFTKTDRETNVMRAASRAVDVVERGGIAICALVSPYRTSRDRARILIGADRFLEVFVDTPLAVCEMRDTKGLYARARRGEIERFTGVNDPYEPPLSPDLTLTTTDTTVERNIDRIVELLVARALL